MAHVAVEPATAPAAPSLPKTPFLDDDGHAMRNHFGQPIMRSAGRLDPHDMIEKAQKLRPQMSNFLPDSPEAALAAPAEPGGDGPAAYASLYNFRRGGPWDAQRSGDTHSDTALIDYANELIGIYAKAAALPLEGPFGALEAANVHNIKKVFWDKEQPTTSPTPGYPYLSVQDAEDICIGYNSVNDDGKIEYKGPEFVQAGH